MKQSRTTRVIIYVGAVLLALFIILPLAWIGFSGFIGRQALLLFPPDWLKYGMTVDNYDYIFTGKIPQAYETTGQTRSMISQEVRQVPQAIWNSAIVAFSVMLINWLLGSLAAYAYARLRFPGRTATFYFITLSRLIPTVALAMPYYLIVQRAKLLDTHFALILIYSVLTLPFTILIMVLHFRNMPPEIEEAAQIDGCGPFGTLFRIAVPLALPSIIGTGLFAFMVAYSEFLFGLLISTSRNSRTVSVLLGSISLNPDVTWSLLGASVVIGLLPTLILVVPIWRFMVRGLVMGGGR
jgi:ABC-type glycerol-3-phosphate transport system permease component